MKGKGFMATVLSTSMLAACIPGLTLISGAEDSVIPAVVSGYVSADSGSFTLAGTSKTPEVYVDAAEHESVIRATADLKSDIYKVTGVTPTSAESSVLSGAAFRYTDTGMEMTAPKDIENGTAYAAVYDSEGRLKSAVKTAAYADRVFTFTKALRPGAGESLKGYIWNDDNNPLCDVIKDTASAELTSQADVIIGTLGTGGVIDTLSAAGKIDVSDIEGKYEAFKIQLVDDTLVIAGSDNRGTIYGIYDVSEKIGVSPWYYMADVPVGHADNLYITLNKPYTEGEPSVRQRGIFINDELALQLYARNTANDPTWENTYKHIYELLLRLKANTLWPSMQKNNYGGSIRGVYFHKYPVNAENAEKYGISIGSSHCEILLRNNEMEFSDFEAAWKAENPSASLYSESPDGSAAATTYLWADELNGTHYDNKELLKAYWRESVHTYGKPTDLYTVGLRNAHDETWDPQYCKKSGEAKSEISDETKKMRAELILDAIRAQREILEAEFCTEESGLTIEDIPQVFIPYKEIQIYYDYYCEHKSEFSYQLPDDISVMWTDDNYGYIRQLPTELDRDRSGGAGIYYHISYHGSPNSYLWLCTTPLSLIREELTKAYDNNAAGAWIINVGDIKPAETQISYIMHMARDMENNTDIEAFLKMQAKRDFGMTGAAAEEYAAIVMDYNKLTMARKPEYTYKDETGRASSMAKRHFTYNVYGDEGSAYTAKYDELVSRAEELNTALDSQHQAPFYEMLLYPLKGARNRAKWMTSGEKSTLYKNERGASINKYANEHDAAYNEIISETEYYNTTLSGGKWNRLMWPMQDHFGTTRNARLYADEVTTSRVTEFGFAQMGVAADDMTFTSYSSRPRYIDIYNKGSGSFDYSVSADKDWVSFNKTSGTVYSDDRIWLTIDASKIQAGENKAAVTVSRTAGGRVISSETIAVTAVGKNYGAIGEKTYVEADGYVSIEAEHYTSSVAYDGMEWKAEKDYARSGDSMKLYPNIYRHTDNAGKSNSAYLEYNVYFENAGTYELDLYRMPTLNERGSVNVRVGVGDGAPTELVGNKEYYVNDSCGDDPWGLGVLTNNETLSTGITVAQGLNKIRVYGVDTTFIFDKIVITTAGSKPFSYFGAPESYNSTYNNSVVLPQASVTTADGEADEYELYLECAGIENDKLVLVKTGSSTEAVKVSAIAYAPDGSALDIKTADVDLSGYTVKGTIELDCVPDTAGAASVAVIAYKSVENPVPVMQPYRMAISTATAEAAHTLSTRTTLSKNYGKQAVITVTAESGELVYAAQAKLASGVFETIPFKTAPASASYNVKIAVSGGDLIEKTVYTTVNVTPDNNGAETVVYSQDFVNDPASDSAVELLNGTVYSANHQNVKLNPSSNSSTSRITITLPQPVTASSGSTVKVSGDVQYGQESGKQTTFRIVGQDSSNANKEVMSCQIKPYDGTGTLTINGSDKLGGKKPSLITSANDASTAPVINYTTIYDPDSGNVTVTITNRTTNASETYYGTMPGIRQITKIEASTNFTNRDRACYFDNAIVSVLTAPQYGIDFDIRDTEGNGVTGAEITVKDADGNVIAPTEGKYMLVEGGYTVAVAKDNAKQTYELDVYPAMESKTVRLVYGTDLVHADVIWDFSDAEAVTATAAQTVSYKGLDIHIDSGDTVGTGGVTWSAGGVNDASANTRYIAYTPAADGTLKVTGKVSASGGRFGIGETKAVGSLKDDGSSTKNTTSTTVSKAVTKGTVYYIETKDKGATITRIEFLPTN